MKKILFISLFTTLSWLSIAQNTDVLIASKTFGKWTAYVDKNPYDNSFTWSMRTPITTQGIKADLKCRVSRFDSIGNPVLFTFVLSKPRPSIYAYFSKQENEKILGGMYGAGSKLFVNVNGVMTEKYITLNQSGVTVYEYSEVADIVNLFKSGANGSLRYVTDPIYYEFSLAGFTKALDFLKTQYANLNK